MVFPILVVWLCVMMLIIVASIFGGFVNRVVESNRDLMGDIVIDSHAGSGWAHYDELLQDLKKKMPEIEAGTPVIRAGGLFNLTMGNALVQVVGIKPQERARISGFKQSLYLQDAAPRAAVEDLSRGGFPVTKLQLRQRARDNYAAAYERMERLQKQGDAAMSISMLESKDIITKNHQDGLELWVLAATEAAVALVLFILIFTRKRWRKLYVLATLVWVASAVTVAILGFTSYRALIRFEDRQNDLEAELSRDYTTAGLVEALPATMAYKSRTELADALIPKEPSFKVPEEHQVDATQSDVKKSDTKKSIDGCIIGIDIGLIPRDRKGNYDRRQFQYPKATITVVPISQRGSILISQAKEHSFIVVDDSYSKVYDVDKESVYVPFEVAQNMAGMQPVDEDGNPLPPRCSEIQLKIKGGDDPERLLAVVDKIQKFIKDDFGLRYPEVQLEAQTWDQKQATYIKAVKNEKVMITVILGLMSLVVVVVIFLIFWMIVRDKTRDIGIIKALGGSEEGVAGIFLFYGLFIGTVGGVLGGISGTVFMWNTNWIHDSILYDIFGVTIWDRSVYMFDRIPDKVDPLEVAIYVGAAILAGAIGALVPAIRAGAQDPVNAVRYE